MKKIKVLGKVVGMYNERTHVLRKRVYKSKHFFRVGGEWGIDYHMLEMLPEDATIVLEELEGHKWYFMCKSEIESLGRDFIGYKDYGLQVMVKLEDWRTLTPEQEEENLYRQTQGLEPKYIPL